MRLKYLCRLPNGFSFLCEVDGRTIGKAHVTIENNIATIADIIVTDITIRRYWFLPFYKKQLTYRNQGYGTFLLNAVVDKCRILGLTEIVGNIMGDYERLRNWYSKNGFNITEAQISMIFDKRN